MSLYISRQQYLQDALWEYKIIGFELSSEIIAFILELPCSY